MNKRTIAGIIIILTLLALCFAYMERERIGRLVGFGIPSGPELPQERTVHDIRNEANNEEAPSPEQPPEDTESPIEPPKEEPKQELPTTPPEQKPPTNEPQQPPTPTEDKGINLAVPFVVQAPFANWDEIRNEACEEASVIMVAAYMNGETHISEQDADDRIMDIVAWENKTFGYHLDTTAEETAQILREYAGIKTARTMRISSMDDIKTALRKGYPVIVPAYGRALKNPNFRGEGPLYHMIVIKGYTGTSMITHDPGTRNGANYIYDETLLWNAIGDWNNGNPMHGEKVMIIVD